MYISSPGGMRPVGPPPTSGGSVEQAGQIRELQDQVGRQHLMLQTLVRLLLAKGVIKEEEMKEWTKYVDGLDGNVDGRLREAKAPRLCPKCKRNSGARAPKCQFCGEEFETVFLDHQDK